jgi:hypothetical protein
MIVLDIVLKKDILAASYEIFKKKRNKIASRVSISMAFFIDFI